MEQAQLEVSLKASGDRKFTGLEKTITTLAEGGASLQNTAMVDLVAEGLYDLLKEGNGQYNDPCLMAGMKMALRAAVKKAKTFAEGMDKVYEAFALETSKVAKMALEGKWGAPQQAAPPAAAPYMAPQPAMGFNYPNYGGYAGQAYGGQMAGYGGQMGPGYGGQAANYGARPAMQGLQPRGPRHFPAKVQTEAQKKLWDTCNPPKGSGRPLLCYDFQTGQCTRGASCQFPHLAAPK